MKNVMTLQLKVNKDDYAELDRSVFDSSQGEMEDIGFWKAGWRRLKKNRIAMIALAVIIILVLFALLGPVFSPYTYDEQIPGFTFIKPPLTRSNGGVAIRMFNITMLPSAG